MSSFKIAAIATAALFSLGACASAPPAYNFDRTAVIDRNFDDVWTSLAQFFTTNNIQIKTIEKDSGLIYAERMTTRPGQSGKIADIGDCGSPGMDVVQSQSVQLNVFARRTAPGTEVTINTTMQETRCFGSTCVVAQCNSTGALERQLLEFVRRPA